MKQWGVVEVCRQKAAEMLNMSQQALSKYWKKTISFGVDKDSEIDFTLIFPSVVKKKESVFLEALCRGDNNFKTVAELLNTSLQVLYNLKNKN